ncbi:MAG TPA: ComEC/Rec2 family competence protein [Nocardioides sp.]|nr:ComEC/Rec2 family competence protein [Nocardioides sp.]
MASARPADEATAPVDLRAVLLAAAGWAGALAVLTAPAWVPPALVAAGTAACLVWWRRHPASWAPVGCLVAALAVGGGALVRAESVDSGPVARLAADRAVAVLEARVASDPRRRAGRFGDLVVVHLDVLTVEGRGRRFTTRAPVVVLGDTTWEDVALGDTVRTTGRLAPADDPATAAVLTGARDPTALSRAGPVLAAAAAVRAGIRDAVAHAPEDGRELVPALVVGDDARMAAGVVDDFRTTGLTHLTAVSGTNLTLVVGFLLLLARWAGVRARGLVLVGLVGVVGFVLVARTEPSVVRAAAMGTVALLGMGADGRHRGVRALGVAALALLLVDPWLALSYGFALSVLATSGILLLAPWFRDQLRSWTPRWVAEAVAVPLAAQLACTPVVAVLSDEVSLVAVLANMAVAPAVAPATVLGLVGGLLDLVVAPAGGLLGTAAGWCGWWIVAVARRLALLPSASVGWPAGPGSVAALSVLCLVLVPVLAWLLRRRWATVLAVSGLGVLMVVPPPTPGWPPRGWVAVACDVGQGDAVVLHAGAGRGVVVDAGPDPAVVGRCLDRLGVDHVPLLVVSHFHADHMEGIAGVLDGRVVDQVLVTPLADPAVGAREVLRVAAADQVPVRVPALGEFGEVGGLRWQVVAPAGATPMPSEGSAANNASLVLLVEVRGVRLLLAGDLEPEGQAALQETLPGLRVDVLKVPHHGSRHQDQAWLAGLGARVAVVSAGRDNDYGHPAPETLATLERAGVLVARTDVRGDVAVVAGPGGRLSVAGR